MQVTFLSSFVTSSAGPDILIASNCSVKNFNDQRLFEAKLYFQKILFTFLNVAVYIAESKHNHWSSEPNTIVMGKVA